MGLSIVGHKADGVGSRFLPVGCGKWGEILYFMDALCGDIVPRDCILGMTHSSGVGVHDAEACQAVADHCVHDAEACQVIADRMERWLKAFSVSIALDRSTDPPVPDVVISYNENLKSWIEFLRHCGGFSVH